MERMTGTVVRGIRTPIINSGDNLINIVYGQHNQSFRAKVLL